MKAKSLALNVLGLAISIASAAAYSGDMTQYTPSVGSCGLTNGTNDAIVALSTQFMQNGANPNSNPK
ncbi:hypothetical protein MMC28_011594, partial [Mycoblastus sanguinarius]|nr:hypothetical protein [Mycoblastus sanguinarius]